MPPALTALIADYCATHPPAEYLGEPGDVLLWSSHTIHSGSSNLSDRPRIGAFTVRPPPAPRDPQTNAHQRWVLLRSAGTIGAGCRCGRS